jgi:hypothetical protein
MFNESKNEVQLCGMLCQRLTSCGACNSNDTRKIQQKTCIFCRIYDLKGPLHLQSVMQHVCLISNINDCNVKKELWNKQSNNLFRQKPCKSVFGKCPFQISDKLHDTVILIIFVAFFIFSWKISWYLVIFEKKEYQFISTYHSRELG